MKTQSKALAVGVLAWMLGIGLASVQGQAPGAEAGAAGTVPAENVNAPAAEPAVAVEAEGVGPAAEAAAPSAAPAPAVEESAPAPVTAAPEAVTPAAATPVGEPIALPAGKMVIEAADKKELINVSVDNETLENVVTMFTRLTGANIVATSTNLRGLVTVNLRDVEWKAALTSILDLHGLALVEKMPGSAVYSILPRPAADSQPQVVETIFLKYTTATELSPVIKSMLSAASSNAAPATIITFASRNAMVVKTTEPNMREVKRMVDMMDIASKQVCVETKFVELSERASKKLGIKWDSLDAFGVKLAAGPFSQKRDTSRTTDRSTARESSDNARQGTTDNASQDTFDNASRNVQNGATRTTTQRTSGGDESSQDFDSGGAPMDRTITTVDANGVVTVTTLPTRTVTSGGSTLRNNGENFSDNSSASVGRNNTTAKSQNNSTDRSQDYTTSDLNGFKRSIVDSQAAILNVDSLNLVLSALKKTAGVQIVSNPKIVVTSGSTNAMFNVGSREPIIKTSVVRGNPASGQGDQFTSELDTAIETEFIKGGYLETGISLKVVPVVKTDDMIQAQIWPRLSRTDPAQAKRSADGANSWPFINVKEIKTEFTLLSGQTVAVGGLTATQDSKAVTKVPLLGDLPLIGKYLFSHTEDFKDQVETIIFVTLSRAEPEDLKEKVGIPDDSELIHKRMIQRKMRQEEFGQELKAFETAAEADQARKARSGITKPRK